MTVDTEARGRQVEDNRFAAARNLSGTGHYADQRLAINRRRISPQVFHPVIIFARAAIESNSDKLRDSRLRS